MKRIWIAATALAALPCTPAMAQQPEPTAASETSSGSLQQQFEAASTALLEERWPEALAGFEALEERLAGGRNRRSLAIVRVRKASALVRLQRREEAAEALRLGLPELPADDASLNEDRFIGLRTLGELAEMSVDYAEARRHYRAAQAVPVEPLTKLSAYRGLIQTSMFDEPETALAMADEGLTLAQRASAGNRAIGLMHTFRGRVLLNMGRTEEARQALGTALQLLGGLTARVDLADIVARSDLAIAALRARDANDARRYLAYTGAGRFETNVAPRRGRMRPPACGNGIDPGDMVVLEYSILDDGRVGRASPIYASRRGMDTLAFARAALDWSFEPDSFAEMPPLFRTAMRAELRCRTQAEPAGASPGAEEIRTWAAAQGVTWVADEGFALRPLAVVQGELARESGAAPARRLLLLSELADHPDVGEADKTGYLRQAFSLALAEQVPPPLVTSVGIALAIAERGDSRSRRPLDYAPLLAKPEVQANPRILAGLRAAQAHTFATAG